MIIEVGTFSGYELDWSGTPADLIEMAKHYVTYESGLPAAEQLKAPDLVNIQEALTKAQTGHQQAQSEEMKRAISATAYHQAVEEAALLLKESIEQLEWKHRTNLAELEQWGLSTRIGARGKVLISKPHHESEWADFLVAYTAREQSLPAADRLTTPPLPRLIELAAIVTQNRAARETAQNERETGVAIRSQTLGPLLDRLQLACGLLVVLRFDGCVTPALQVWGYKVRAVTSKAAPPEPPAPPA